MTWLWFFITDDKPDFTPQVAVEAAYVLIAREAPPLVVVNPPDPQCPQCKGTGQIKTGDGLSWTRCDCTTKPRTSPAAAPQQQVPAGSAGTVRKSH